MPAPKRTSSGSEDTRSHASAEPARTMAHFRPGRFHALDAETAVMACPAAAAEALAYGTC